MSELAISVVAGPSDRNSGLIRDIRASVALYVGGSGAWRAINLDTGVAATIPSSGHDLGSELIAATLLALQLPSAEEVTKPLLARAGTSGSLDLHAGEWRRLVEAARTSAEAVALLVTTSGSELSATIAEPLRGTGWSVLLCTPTIDLRSSQWI